MRARRQRGVAGVSAGVRGRGEGKIMGEGHGAGSGLWGVPGGGGGGGVRCASSMRRARRFDLGCGGAEGGGAVAADVGNDFVVDIGDEALDLDFNGAGGIAEGLFEALAVCRDSSAVAPLSGGDGGGSNGSFASAPVDTYASISMRSFDRRQSSEIRAAVLSW